jgi:predicted transcriptional regulator
MSTTTDPTQKKAEVTRALARAGYDDVLMIDRETASTVLTTKRRELLEHIREGEIESVRQLATAVDRDKAAVSRDLKTLFTYDLIDYREEGSRKVPELKHETVIVEPIV